MRRLQLASLLLGLGAVQVGGHGHVTNIVINGVSYLGWDIDTYPYETSPPTVCAWGTPNTSNGFIAPTAYQTSDIICHLNATNAQGYATVAAGDKIFLQWTAWPSSHHGPVIDYLANCGSSCSTVDKTTLEFFKISGVGLVNDTTPPGYWGADELEGNNNGWIVEIPPTVAPGNYVLRHEIIALHSAGSAGGAQNYPQCFNLHITGGGSAQPAGTLGEHLYSETDPGIVINIYTSLASYDIPGPTPYGGDVSIAQSSSTIATWGNATAGGGGGGSPPPTTTGGGGGGTTATTTTKSTTLITTTTTIRTTTTTAGSGGGQSLYGQCGGAGYSGPTACVASASCSTENPYYAQCVPTAA